MSGNIKTIALTTIEIDDDIQQRSEGCDNHVVDEYRQLWDADTAFPPVDVFDDGAKKWLADGFHRVVSARHAGKETIRARIHQGKRRDAIVFACGENNSHGIRRTNSDKRKAVITLLKLFTNRSNRWIAEKALVGHPFVQSLKLQLESNSSLHNGQTATIGRDGKKRRRKPAKKKNKPSSLSPPKNMSDVQKVCNHLTYVAVIHDKVLSKHKHSFGKMANAWTASDRQLVSNYLSEGIKKLTKWRKELEGLK